MFDAVLVANRGEIAVRVIRTLRALGVRSVAVHSDADAGAPHVRAADLAVRLPRGYLDIDGILDAALRSGAQAIHPGYGFLAENAAFARACAERGVVFVGPPPEAIEAMGDKIRAKETVAKAGVPVVPGAAGELSGWAEFPALIKPSAGGGGKGMLLVRSAAELPEAIESARRTAVAAFGDGTLLIERFVENPRHIEIQVLADGFGNVVHLGERECSLQRRHQKIIEEAPSPFVDAATRELMGSAAVEAARSVGYAGAGTVEFIVPGGEGPGEFYFMEMNTRLQVEHPVTELVCRVGGEPLDLVERQLRVAAGEPLGFTQDEVGLVGHAVEGRVYAEDPRRGFLPTGGTVLALHEPSGLLSEGVRRSEFRREISSAGVRWPDFGREVSSMEVRRPESGREVSSMEVWRPESGREISSAGVRRPESGREVSSMEVWRPESAREVSFAGETEPDGSALRASARIRVDSGLAEGVVVGSDYDPMLSKVIAWAPERAGALRALRDVLGQTVILGVTTNIAFLRALLAHPEVVAGRLDTGLVERHLDELLAEIPDISADVLAVAGLHFHPGGDESGDPWDVADGWRLGEHAWARYRLESGGEIVDVRVRGTRGAAEVAVAGSVLAAGLGPEGTATVDGMTGRCITARHGDTLWIASGGTWPVTLHHQGDPGDRVGVSRTGDGVVRSPMPGTVLVVKAAVGDRVPAGQALLIVEAMKMEHTVTAPLAGVVTELPVRAGQQVAMDATLAVVTPEEA